MATKQREVEKVPANKRAIKRVGGNPTIYDIAELAGVNPSTVSRALNNPGRISQKTEEKIRAAAKELNYQANFFARALPTGRTKIVAVIVADITNPMFFEAVRGVEKVTDERQYTLIVAESEESAAREAEAIEKLLPTVDGIFLVTTRLSEEEIKRLNERKPIVLLNRKVKGVMDVIPDVEPGIIQAIEHLKNQGLSSVAFVAGPTQAWMSRHRWELIMKASIAKKMKVVEIGPNNPTLEGGYAAADKVLASGMSAAICYNDLMAIGLLQALGEKKVSVPKQLGVIGFDNIFGSDLTTPALSTIKSPLREMGTRAALKLLDKLNDKGDSRVKTIDLATELVIRASTKRA
jgi:LacI family transcriptional regulator